MKFGKKALACLMGTLVLLGGCKGAKQPAPSAGELAEGQPEEPLTYVSYSCGNGESGTGRSFEMYYSTEEQRYIAVYSEKEWGGKEKTWRSYVGKEVFDGLTAITERYRVWQWTDLEEREEFALDGDSYRLMFNYGRLYEGTEIYLGDGDVWPEGASEALEEIESYVMEAAKGG